VLKLKTTPLMQCPEEIQINPNCQSMRQEPANQSTVDWMSDSASNYFN